jgi:hypothetical protein
VEDEDENFNEHGTNNFNINIGSSVGGNSYVFSNNNAFSNPYSQQVQGNYAQNMSGLGGSIVGSNQGNLIPNVKKS